METSDGYSIPRRTTSTTSGNQALGRRPGRGPGRPAGCSTKRRSHMRGWGTTRSGSSTTRSPTSRTSASRVRGPKRTVRTRCGRLLQRLAAGQQLAGAVGGGQLDHQVEVGTLVLRARPPARSHRGGTPRRRRPGPPAAPRPGAGRPAGPPGWTRAPGRPAGRCAGGATASTAPRRDYREPETRTPVDATSSASGGRSLRTVTATARSRASAQQERRPGDRPGPRAVGRSVRPPLRPPAGPGRRSRPCRPVRRSAAAAAMSTQATTSTEKGCARSRSSGRTPCTPSTRRSRISMRSPDPDLRSSARSFGHCAVWRRGRPSREARSSRPGSPMACPQTCSIRATAWG